MLPELVGVPVFAADVDVLPERIPPEAFDIPIPDPVADIDVPESVLHETLGGVVPEPVADGVSHDVPGLWTFTCMTGPDTVCPPMTAVAGPIEKVPV